MIAAMNAAPEPATMRFALDFSSTSMSADFKRTDEGLAIIISLPGDSLSRRFRVGVDSRAQTGYVQRVDANDAPLGTPLAGTLGKRHRMYPITLLQVFRFVRTYGSPSPSPSPTVPSVGSAAVSSSAGDTAQSERLRTIARVSAFEDYDYDVVNVGRTSYEGHGVYHLRFIPRHGLRDHPLRDAFVDTTTMLPRQMQADFQVGAMPSGHFAFTFGFAQSGAYWIATTNHVSARAQLAFILKSGTLEAHVSDVVFDQPLAVPTATTPAPTPAPHRAFRRAW